MKRPMSELVNVRHAAHGKGGITLFISGRGGRTRTLWIAVDELPEVIEKLTAARAALTPLTPR